MYRNIIILVSLFIFHFQICVADRNIGEIFLENYCISCHDNDLAKGDISFEDLFEVNLDNLDLWKTSLSQVIGHAMPPSDKKKQPSVHEAAELKSWLETEFNKVLEDRGGFHEYKLPSKGNYVNHNLLFDLPLKELDPAYTPSRIWRVHPNTLLVRYNDLAHFMPAYNPKFPGQLAHGDALVMSHASNDMGVLKLSLGSDHIFGFQDGSGWWSKIPNIMPTLSLKVVHGLNDYANMYGITVAEVEQLAYSAETLLKYLVLGPQVDSERYQSPQSVKTRYKNIKEIGKAGGFFYKKGFERKYNPMSELMNKTTPPNSKELARIVKFLFEKLIMRPPNDDEVKEYSSLIEIQIKALGKAQGLIHGCLPIFLHQEALFRKELGGKQLDASGRKKLEGYELMNAISSALGYLGPDEGLKQAMRSGKLKSKEGIRKEVTRLLSDPSYRKPRIVQFFRDYFGYADCIKICKDQASIVASGLSERESRGSWYMRSMVNLVHETDRLIQLILSDDRDVLKQLLTTNKAVIKALPSNEYPRQTWGDEYTLNYYNHEPSQEIIKNFIAGFNARVEKDLNPTKKANSNKKKYKSFLTSPLLRDKKNIINASLKHAQEIYVREYWPTTSISGPKKRYLVDMPKNQRLGILTQPSWLISHSDAMDNHAILRGIWIREKLLGGVIPDVPITVDAVLPDEPEHTLRHRMRVTQEKQCWKCHQKMDPLGLPFENFNHIGMFREMEKGKPVDTSGEIVRSGDPSIDGKVSDPFEMIHKLAESKRVEQVFVRYAFRYWMGRNENVNDAPTLRAAYKAYKGNGGSMNALITELLVSDSFLYRK